MNQTPKYFVYWAQGFDQAPPLVQMCVAQMRRVIPKDQLVELTAENLQEYLQVPEAVVAHTQEFRAHLSDIIRVGLLAKHGGVWLDATVWVDQDPSKFLADQVEPTGFFAYRYSQARLSSWLIASKPENYAVALLYEALCAYWESNSELIGYFMFHELFEVLYFSDQKFHVIVSGSPFVPADPPHRLQREKLFKPLDVAAIREILTTNPIQKLTYKPGKRDVSAESLFTLVQEKPLKEVIKLISA